jgi:pimeloyl-ACP methyl ester carboxylesterase
MHELAAETLMLAGRSVRVWRGGAGPGLVLLHGGVGDAALHWQPVWGALAESFQVIAPDWPGFGRSAALAELSLDGLLEWLDHLLDAVDLPRAAIVGNSFGATIARLFAASCPARATHLVLVNSGGPLPPIPGVALAVLRSPVLTPFFALARHWMFSPSGLRFMVPNPSVLTPAFVRAANDASYPFMRTVRQVLLSAPPHRQTPYVPVLVLWGVTDRLMPVARGRRIATGIPGARFCPIDAAGHLPQLDRPDLFVDAVRSFCNPS